MSRDEKNASHLNRIADGDRAAENEFVSENAGLVAAIARRFEGRGTEREDLIQQGYVGLIKAARGFDAAKGTCFSTYAVPFIAGEMRQGFRNGGAVRVSRDIRARAGRIAQARERYITENGTEPTVSTLCELCGYEAEEITEAIRASEQILSLDEPIGEDGMTRGETQRDYTATDAAEAAAIREAVGKLDGRERAVTVLRGIAGLTQEEVAQRLHLTQTTVSRTEKRAKEKLKEMLCADGC